MTNQQNTHRGNGGRSVATVLASLVGIVGLTMLLGGIAIIGVHGLARDDDGYYSTHTERLDSDAYAIATDEVDLGGDSGGLGVDDLAATARLTAESADDAPVFVGIARKTDVDAYLAGVGHSEVTDVRANGPAYEQVSGGAPKAPPATQDFWVAQSQGSGQQLVDWDVEGGTWTALVMNADASSGIAVDVEAGAKVSWLIWVGIGLALIGLAVTGTAAFIVSRLVRNGPGIVAPPAAAQAPA